VRQPLLDSFANGQGSEQVAARQANPQLLVQDARAGPVAIARDAFEQRRLITTALDAERLPTPDSVRECACVSPFEASLPRESVRNQDPDVLQADGERAGVAVVHRDR
jgi:hypothetical protein